MVLCFIHWLDGFCTDLGHIFLHVIFKFLINVSRGFLILLILRDKIIHVGLGLSELHFIHALPSVPVEESLPSEHGSELFGNTLKDFLYCCGVAHKGGSHLQSSGWNATHGSLNIVRDPLHEVGRVLVLNIQHLLVNLFHGHTASEHSSHCEIASVPRVTGSHHVLGIEHLLGKLGHRERSVLLGSTSSQWGEPWHEEVEPGERDHVDSQLPEISIELAREPETSGDARHSEGHEMVEITIGGGLEFEGSEADIV